MNCKECGNELIGGATRCGQCGSMVVPEEAAVPDSRLRAGAASADAAGSNTTKAIIVIVAALAVAVTLLAGLLLAGVFGGGEAV